MKRLTIASCAMLAVAGVAQASAQDACTQAKGLMASSHAAVKALQGARISEDKDVVTYASKLTIAGFKPCTIDLGKAPDDLSDYWQHHLACEGEAADSDTANQLIDALWTCTKDIYSERKAEEAWIDNTYRIIGFEGEVPSAGRDSGSIDFGETDYVFINVEKSYDVSETFSLHLHWSFTE